MARAPRYRMPEPALISPWGPYWMSPETPSTSEFYEPDFSSSMPEFPSPLPPKSMNEPFWQELAKNPELTKKFGMLAPDMPHIRTIERHALYPEDQEGGKSRYPQQRPTDQSNAPIFDDQGNPYTPPPPLSVTATANPDWKSPADTYREWKEQRDLERRSFDPLSAGPPPPFNMVRPEGEPGGFPAQQTRYDPLISMEGRVQPPGVAPLIRGRPDPYANLSGEQAARAESVLLGPQPSNAHLYSGLIQQQAPTSYTPFTPQQSTQGVADVFGAPQEGPGYPFPGMFDQPSSMARPFKRQEAAVAGTAPLIAGPSVSDRVRGNRYTNMSKRDRDALNLTIAGELSEYAYDEPERMGQEVANMVETITTRAAQKGKSIEDTVKEGEGSQYNPWLTLETQENARGLLKEHGFDVRRAVSNAVTGNVMPTHEGLTSYHANWMDPKPKWARGIEPAAQTGKGSKWHSFYTDIAPWSSSPRGPDLPAAPDFGGIASRDIPGSPPNTPFDPDAPMAAKSVAIAGTDLPPPADYTEAPQPLTPEQVTAGQQRVDQILDPALQSRAPLIALAEDRATRERALQGPPAGVPVPPATPTPPAQNAPLIAPAPATVQPAPAAPVSTMRDVALAAHDAGFIGRIEEDPVTHRISGYNHAVDPGFGRGKFPGGEPGGNFPNGQPWTPEQQAQIAAAVPGVTLDAGGLRLTPAAAAPAPLIAPPRAIDRGHGQYGPSITEGPIPTNVSAVAPVTPRQEVTPGTPLHPEDTTGLPPAGVPPVTPMTPEARTVEMERRAAVERERLGGTYSPTDAPLIAPPPASTTSTTADVPLITPPASTTSTTTGAPLIANPNATFTTTNPRLSPREIERRARTRGFGTVENLTGDRWARAGGAVAGVAAGLTTGNPLLAAGLGVQGYRSGDDVRRGIMNRNVPGMGPLSFIGNIFGMGRGRDKDKKKNDEKYGSMPKDPSASSMPPASAYSGGLGSDRYVGGVYGGQSTGGRYLTEGTGGAFR